MALLTTLLGIGLALVAALAGRPLAAILCVYVLLLGVGCLAIGWLIGADGPRAASAAFRGAVVLPLSIGAAAGAIGIWLAALLIQAQGNPPLPWASAVGTAASAALAAAIAKLQGLDALMPAALSQRMVRSRYAGRFPDLSGAPTGAFRAAYEAINYPQLQQTGQPPIRGWGFDDTARRLALIRAAL